MPTCLTDVNRLVLRNFRRRATKTEGAAAVVRANFVRWQRNPVSMTSCFLLSGLANLRRRILDDRSYTLESRRDTRRSWSSCAIIFVRRLGQYCKEGHWRSTHLDVQRRESLLHLEVYFSDWWYKTWKTWALHYIIAGQDNPIVGYLEGYLCWHHLKWHVTSSFHSKLHFHRTYPILWCWRTSKWYVLAQYLVLVKCLIHGQLFKQSHILSSQRLLCAHT